LSKTTTTWHSPAGCGTEGMITAASAHIQTRSIELPTDSIRGCNIHHYQPIHQQLR
jgi:hypothetical protein